MNVVYYGMVPILAMAVLLAAAVAPFLLASLTRRSIAAAVALGQRPLIGVPFSGTLPATASGRAIPMDVVPANQAWRAPPTVRSQHQPDDPVGSRADRPRR